MKKKAKKSEGCTSGLFIGSVLRSLTDFLLFLLRIIAKILVIFGLWVPAVYAAFGAVLYFAFSFNPFDFSLYSTIYLSGAVACIICSLIISVKNLIVKPAKSVYKGYKHPIWEKKEEELEDGEEISLKNRWETYNQTKKEVELNPPEIEAFQPKKEYPAPEYLLPNEDFKQKNKKESEKARITLFPDWLPKKVEEKKTEEKKTVMVSEPASEKPEVYFSKLEPDLLVHEYSDRYELYRLEGNKKIPVRIEYK